MFKGIGKKLGMDVKVIITDGSQPIGLGIGPVLEAADVMAVLRNDVLAPQDLKNKAIHMAGTLLEMTSKYNGNSGIKKARELLESGKALKKMNEIIVAQGKSRGIKLGGFKYVVQTGKSGKVFEIDNKIIAKIARIAGAPKDKGSGIYLNVKVKDRVPKKGVLYTVYAENKFKLGLAVEFLKKGNGYLIK